MLVSVTIQESGMHPWAAYVEKKSYYFDSKKELLQTIKKHNEFDIGIMQINSWWLKRLKLSPEEIVEVENNIMLGSWILADCLKRYDNDLEHALSCYNTGRITPVGKKYSKKVLAHLSNF